MRSGRGPSLLEQSDIHDEHMMIPSLIDKYDLKLVNILDEGNKRQVCSFLVDVLLSLESNAPEEL